MMHRSPIRRGLVLGLVVVVTGAEAMMPSLPSTERVCVGEDTILHRDTIHRDTAFVDTLHEVTVMGDSLRLAPVKDAISQSLGKSAGPSVKSLGEVLNKVAPGAMDYVLHPFGFSERKKKKKKKRMEQILKEFDRVDAPNEWNLKLDSILRLEGLKQ